MCQSIEFTSIQLFRLLFLLLGISHGCGPRESLDAPGYLVATTMVCFDLLGRPEAKFGHNTGLRFYRTGSYFEKLLHKN